MKFKAVFFDFDGVIGKTMEDNYRAWCKAFSHYNIILDQEEYYLLEGKNAQGVAQIILAKHGMNSILPASLASMKEKYYSENNSFSFYQGVPKLINTLKGLFRLGLVSGTSSQRLKRTVPGHFLDAFDVVITGDSVKETKPEPEPYLMASNALSISPKDCIVVENAPFGIESAKKAGMYCIAICSTLNRKYLHLADIVLDDFQMLYSFFNSLKD